MGEYTKSLRLSPENHLMPLFYSANYVIGYDTHSVNATGDFILNKCTIELMASSNSSLARLARLLSSARLSR